MAHELGIDDLRWRCPDGWVPWSSSTEVPSATAIVGQQRAVEAIALGLEMPGVGYNVFVAGLAGTGRLTTIKRYLDGLADEEPSPDDVCFVFNFRAPEEPTLLRLNAGAGRRLRDGMDRLVRELAEHLPEILGSSQLRQRLEQAVEDLQQQERALFERLEAEVQEKGFNLVQIQAGPVTRPEVLPVVDGETVSTEKLPALVEAGTISEERAAELREAYGQLSERLQEVFHAAGKLRREGQRRIEAVRRELLQPTFDEMVASVRDEVADPRANGYLDEVRRDLADHLDLFVSDEETDGDPYLRWRVNVAVDNADAGGRPVVIETEPSYANLFGTIERTLKEGGETVTSHLRIRAGSMLRANGGFLILNAEDLLLEPRVWPGLKRALKYRRVAVQPLESVILGTPALKPQAVPLNVKVVVIGDRGIYDALYRHDSDFQKIFKVLADFDSVMAPEKENAHAVLSVLARICREESLPPLDRSGMAAMLEEAVRRGRWRHRLSSRFSDLADGLREAAHEAKTAGAEVIAREHVETAREASLRRHRLSEDRTHEYIAEGLVRIATDGRHVGTLNGLAVYDMGHHRFGKPVRISARVGLGRQGVINIERQAGLSGPTHDKGVSILTGFLRGAFARRVPLSMSCSVTFEQSYGGIDGDSASSTEVYAIVSALAEIPLRQDIAVTGSVDQDGRVQAIGGVNEKVEGFFRVCCDAGLTGDQGVMIPAANVADLHLARDVADAVAEGRFHVWSVDHVDDGIELLTGETAGTRDDDGAWTEGSIYARCEARLEEMSRLMRRAVKDPEKKDVGSDDEGAAGGDAAARV